VVRNAQRLAPLLGADVEVVTIAAVLHDYASVRDAALADAHHEHGAADARRLLEGMGYPPERIALVAESLPSHRGSVRLAQASADADCLASADGHRRGHRMGACQAGPLLGQDGSPCAGPG